MVIPKPVILAVNGETVIVLIVLRISSLTAIAAGLATNPRPLPDLDRVIEIPFRAGPSDTGRGGKFEG